MANDRYSVDFNLNVRQTNNAQNSDLGGSIYTPLGHYTVMGSTTFLSTKAKSSNSQPTDQEQHLSAFVVYLDKPAEYPLGVARPAKKGEPSDDPFK